MWKQRNENKMHLYEPLKSSLKDNPKPFKCPYRCCCKVYVTVWRVVTNNNLDDSLF